MSLLSLLSVFDESSLHATKQKHNAKQIKIHSSFFIDKSPKNKNKKVHPNKRVHRKTQTPIVATQNQINGIMVSDILPVGICAFTKFKSSMPKKGYNIPYINRKTISPKSLFGFV